MKRSKRSSFPLILICLVLFIMIFIIEAFVLVNGNEKQSRKNSDFLVGQVEGSINLCDEKFSNSITLLEKNLLVYAEQSAKLFSAEYEKTVQERLDEFKTITDLEEVCILTNENIIVASTNLDKVGSPLLSEKSKAELEPLLSKTVSSLTEHYDGTTRDGVLYFGAWTSASELLIMSINKEILFQELVDQGIYDMFLHYPVPDGDLLIMLSCEDMTVVGSSDSELLEKTFDAREFISENDSSEIKHMTTRVQGVRSYVSFTQYSNRYILISEPIIHANSDIHRNLVLVASVLLVAYITLCFIVTRFASVIDKRKAELQENEDLLASAGIGLWHILLFNEAKPEMYGNKKMLELLGVIKELSPQDLYEHWFSRIPAECMDSVLDSVHAMQNGKFSENDYLWKHPILGDMYVRCGGTATFIEGKGFILRGYHYNVTDTVKKEKQQKKDVAKALEDAKRANAAKTSFLARMSHDIRTPLNGIIGLLEISDKTPEDTKLLAENRAKEKIAADYLLSLINDVLNMSKLEDGETKLAHECFSLNGLLNDVITIAEARSREKNIRFRSKPESAAFIPYVFGSPLHVRQIFLNILGNAIKYNKPSGFIDFRAEEVMLKGDIIIYRFIISDTGIGMSDEFVQHIFEPFSQERIDARSVYQGTGLGMSIVKALVDKMNGEIQVRSKKDAGSTFVITLPFEIAKEEEYPEEHISEITSIDGIRVLLAEDNILNTEIAVALLQEAGAIVTAVPNGKEAVETFNSNPPDSFDVILMDIMMPEMDGIEACKTIRMLKRPDAKRIPILAMTANAFDEDKRKCKLAGMNGHIAKPINMEIVISSINTALKR